MKTRRLRSQPQTLNFKSPSDPSRSRRVRDVVVSLVALVAIALLALFWLFRPRPPKPFAAVMTVGGPGLKIANSTLPDLFGVAVDDENRVFFSDGTGDSVRRIDADGSLKTIASDLDTPSGLAFERGDWFGDGSLIVANTGGHTIVRIDIGTGRPNLVAGAPGQSGFADGGPDQSRFNGAVGVAVNKDGVIFVADTYNDRIRAIFSERVTQPLAVEGAGGGSEQLRLPLVGYTYLRVGRDRNDQPTGDFPNGAITFRRDEQGRVIGVRARRGTRIDAGAAIGALNGQHHVHLIAGPYGEESNPLEALRLPGLIDTVAPTIESVAITIVRAYDQVDGAPRRRRLGVYRLGYQLLRAGGSPEAGTLNA